MRRVVVVWIMVGLVALIAGAVAGAVALTGRAPHTTRTCLAPGGDGVYACLPKPATTTKPATIPATKPATKPKPEPAPKPKPATKPKPKHATVTVDLAATQAAVRHKFGTYRSEERADWDKIYDVDSTLGPLGMVSNRMQISLEDAEIAADGTWTDAKGTQRGILRLLAKSSADDVLVTVGFPWTARAQKFIAGGFTDAAWRPYFLRVYSTLAKALAGAAVGKPVLVEIFGEPDLGVWDWVYGKDRTRVFDIARMVHDEFRRYPGFKVGGLGFACPEQDFICLPRYVDAFVDYAKGHGMRFDFWSFHAYLGWTDATDTSQYPPAPGPYNFASRAAKFRAALQRKGLGGATVVCTEYAWQDGDGATSWGFKDAKKSARRSMTDHRSAARALHAIDIVRATPGVDRAYWAQGVGTAFGPPDQKYAYAYNPLVVYHNGAYRYKAGYYAFWMYGKLAGARGVAAVASNPKLGVLATKRGVIVYNKSPAAQPVSLAVAGAPGDTPCELYVVDAQTYKLSAGGLDAVVSGPTRPVPPRVAGVATLAQAQARLASLGPEAVACLLFV
jgi:hypothetical protein